MISMLKGVLAEKLPDAIVLECGGVGYHIKIPANAVAELPEVGEETMLYVQMIKTKTDISLVGFSDEQQRVCFNYLSDISGCGIKSSLAILGSISPNQLYRHVASNDDLAISKVKGVGKKLAQITRKWLLAL